MIIKGNRVDVEMRKNSDREKKIEWKKLIQNGVIYFTDFLINFTDDGSFIFLRTKNAPKIMTGLVQSRFRGHNFFNF